MAYMDKYLNPAIIEALMKQMPMAPGESSFPKTAQAGQMPQTTELAKPPMGGLMGNAPGMGGMNSPQGVAPLSPMPPPNPSVMSGNMMKPTLPAQPGPGQSLDPNEILKMLLLKGQAMPQGMPQ